MNERSSNPFTSKKKRVRSPLFFLVVDIILHSHWVFLLQLLLAWVLSNGFLVAVVLTATDTFTTTVTDSNTVEQSTSVYLTIILYWSVFCPTVDLFACSCSNIAAFLFEDHSVVVLARKFERFLFFFPFK